MLRIINLQKGYPDWEEISKLLKELNIIKSSKQCKDKWYNNSEKKEYYNCKFGTRIKNNWSFVEVKEFLRILHLQKEYPVWKEISKLLKEVNIIKSSSQCYKQWYLNRKKKEYYTCKFSTRIYTPWKIFEEKELLRILHLQKEYPDWDEISKLLKVVNVEKLPNECLNKWNNNKKKKDSCIFKWDLRIRTKNTWSIFEENELMRLVHLQKEYPNWKEISNLLKKVNIDKSSQQCYYKWYYCKEKKEINISKFNAKRRNKLLTRKQEKKLLKLCFAYSPQFKKINDFFEDIEDKDYIKSKFMSIIRKGLIKACKLSNIKNVEFLFNRDKCGIFVT